jgi:hypothetical protein
MFADSDSDSQKPMPKTEPVSITLTVAFRTLIEWGKNGVLPNFD